MKPKEVKAKAKQRIIDLENELANLKASVKEFDTNIEQKSQLVDSLLVKNEDIFRTAFEKNNVAMAIVDQSGRFVKVNKAICTVFDYSKKYLLQSNFLAITHPDDRERSLQSFNNCMKDGKPYEIEKKYITKKKDVIIGLTNIAPVFDGSGSFLYAIASLLNFTRKTRVVQKLRESEQNLRTLVNFAPYGILLTDGLGKIVFSNPAHHKMYGYKNGALIGKYFWDLVSDETNKLKTKAFYLSLFTRPIKPESYYSSDKTQNGKIIHTKTDWNYKKLANGEVEGIISIVSDITKQVDDENMLKDKTIALKLANDIAGIGYWSLDPAVGVPVWSSHIYNIYGRDPKLGPHPLENYKKIYKGEWFETFNKAIKNAIENGIPYDIQLKLELETGKTKWIRAICQPDVEKGPKGYCLRGTIQDITPIKQNELLLQKERNLVNQYLNVAGVMLIVLDLNQNVNNINAKGCEILGYPKKEILGKNWFENFIVQQNVEQIKDVFNQIIAGKLEPVEYYENPIVRKDGEIRQIAWHNSVLYGKDNRIEGIFSSGEDITERKAAELKLQESENRYNLVMDATKHGLWDWDIPSDKVYWSDHSYQMLGYKENEFELNYEHWARMVHPDDLKRSEPVILKALKTGKPFTTEFRLKKKDNGWLWVMGKGKCIEFDQNNKPKRMVGTHTDVEEKKQAEKKLVKHNIELIKAKEKAEESDRLKTAFLNNMSHEIRTPMNGIINFSRLLMNNTDTGKKNAFFAKMVVSSAERLLTIITDILDISQLESKQIKIANAELALNSEIDKLSHQYADKLGESILLHVRKGFRETEDIIYADSHRIIQVLHKLISNAIKFTTKGSIAFGYNLVNNKLEFFVEDTGIGIAKEHQQKIFNRFWQVETDMTKQPGGTGLGLSIAKEIVDLMGGEIWVKSAKNKGASFYFTIPYIPIQEKAQLGFNTKTNHKQKPTILVTEDDNINMLFFETFFSDLNIEMIKAKNGLEAVNCFKENLNISLIIMDLKMPIMNGFEATRQIRQIDKQIPIIALTGLAAADDKEKAIRAGCTAYLTKPIEDQELKNLVLQLH